MKRTLQPLHRIKHIIAATAMIAICISFASVDAAPARKSANEIFQKWQTWQYLYSNETLNQPIVTQESFQNFLDEFPDEMQGRAQFLGLSQADFRNLAANKEAQNKFKMAMTGITNELNSNMAGFVDRLKKNHFSTEIIVESEKKTPTTQLGSTYRKTITVPLTTTGKANDQAFFSLAGRMFDYAFRKQNANQFYEFLTTPKYYGIARLFYANIWYRLSGNGWRIWHTAALDSLRQEVETGHEVVYIAGGTDIYQLLKAKVYKIRVIDPIFPSQTKYYSEGWQYLVDCGVGDEIRFDDTTIVMKRTGCKNLGNFTTDELSDGKPHSIPKSIIDWRLFDTAGKEIGYVIYERRFAIQDDFVTNSKRVLLISFNELAYATDTSQAGWGFDSSKWPTDIKIYVKQLEKPIGKTECQNLTRAQASPFSFIRLGTSID